MVGVLQAAEAVVMPTGLALESREGETETKGTNQPVPPTDTLLSRQPRAD